MAFERNDASMSLPKVLDLRNRLGKGKFRGFLSAWDPGETTGVTIMSVKDDCVIVMDQFQIPSWPLESFIEHVDRYALLEGMSQVVYESYHIYAWKLQEHEFAEVPTIQIIGALKTLCIQKGLGYDKQTAQTGKAFWTDDRLETFGAYRKGMKHARDSLRHALQYSVFGIGGK